MKKLLSLILILAILFSLCSLAACGEKNKEQKVPENEVENTENTETVEEEEIDIETLKASKPNEYVREKVEAGIPVTIAFCGMANGYFTMTQMAGGIGEAMEKEGFVYQTACADSDVSKMLDQCENFITMGCAAIVLMAGDGNPFVDLNTQALEMGTYLVFYGIDVDFDALNTQTDTKAVGEASSRMLLEWADQRYPDAGEGELHAAVLGHVGMLETKNMYDGAMSVLKADPRVTIGYSNDGAFSLEDGFTYTEAAMTADPDIRLIWAFQMGTAIGVNSYLISQDYDLTEFCVVGNSVDDTTEQALKDASEGKGTIRGTIQAGESVTATTVKLILDALDGKVQPPYTAMDPLYPVTSSEWTFSGI